jgi:phosphoribosyl 1,2-cyclic phosphate phosphodiesterase
MADLQVTFLGTGTSLGVPVIGCGCAVCASSDPRDKRTRASIYVQSPECSWVIDTGADFRAQSLREKISMVDAVVYTHSHTDHIMGFDDLRVFCSTQRSLPIYASADTMSDLKRVFAFAFNGENRFPGYIHPDPRVIEGKFSLGKTELTPLPLPHGRERVNGYLLSRGGERLLAYLSDCKEVPEQIIAQIAGVKVLVIDALRHSPHPTHLSVSDALEIVEKAGPRQTWFTHICHELAHAETETDLPEGVRLAYDGLKIKV